VGFALPNGESFADIVETGYSQLPKRN